MAILYKMVDGGYLGAPATTVTGDTTQRIALGSILRAQDPTYGDGEVRYVKFTGTVANGDCVVLDDTGMTAVQASSAGAKGQLGLALAAQTSGCYGYVLLRGTHDSANVATGVAAATALGVTATAGRLGATSTGNKADGAFERISTSASNVGIVELNWPSWTGNG